MLSRIVLLVCLVLSGWQIASAGVVRIADGDCAGLSAAVKAASDSIDGSTTVILSRNGNYVGCSVGAAAGAIIIDGQGARMQGGSICAGRPSSNTAPAVSMTLRNMTLTPADDGKIPSGCPVNFGGTFGNFVSCSVLAAVGDAAVLNLETVTLRGFTYLVCNSNIPNGVIVSSGSLSLRNVTATDISARLIDSEGSLEIYNSTFANNAPLNPYLQLPLFSSYPLVDGLLDKKAVTIANSLFAVNAGPVCDDSAYGAIAFSSGSSRGGNVSDSASCGFSASNGDKIVSDAQLGSFGNHGGLVPTLAINGGSAAKAAGNLQYCEALDARAYTRSPHGCDAGAYEYGGGSGALTASGMNGFYYDPNANGHYVSLQRIHDNGDIAIVWSTFDTNGNQAWVYGVGQLTDKRIHANMAQNIGGVLQAGGPPTGSSVRPWGTVDIDLTSCTLAQFSYASTLDGFGSGTFPVTRLAFVSDFGCAE